MEGITLLIVVSAAIGGIFILITALSYLYGLKGIKAKTAGNGQHGTARWATNREIKMTYHRGPQAQDSDYHRKQHEKCGICRSDC